MHVYSFAQLHTATFEWMSPSPNAWSLEISARETDRGDDGDWITVYEHSRGECKHVGKRRLVVDNAASSETTTTPAATKNNTIAGTTTTGKGGTKYYTNPDECPLNFSPQLENGYAVNEINPKGRYKVGSLKKMACNRGFMMEGSIEYMCSFLGTTDGRARWQKQGEGRCVLGLFVSFFFR